MTANLADVLSGSFAGPAAAALRYEGGIVTYADLGDRARGVAALLAGRGVGPGDRVALVLPNAPSFVAAYKYPRHVVVVADLPNGPTGKIAKRAIDRQALARSLRG